MYVFNLYVYMYVLVCLQKKKRNQFFLIQSLIQISHKLSWFGLKNTFLFDDYI